MVKRLLEGTFIRYSEEFPVVLLTGPRRTGKTTLCRGLLGKTHRFVSLEDPDNQRPALDDPRSFLELNPPPVIMAGIQYAPELPRHLQPIVDRDRYWHGQFILTGAQNFRLMENMTQCLAGRFAPLTLYPASVEEADGAEAPARASLDAIADWILRGGYPELREHPEIDPRTWCANYLRLFLERDVRRLMNVEDLDAFERFLRLTAARTASILNVSELAREAGVSQPTAKRWLSLLEASGLVFLLPPHPAEMGRRTVKSPKLYFIDTALASYLLGLRESASLVQGPFFAPLFETAAVSEHLKHLAPRASLFTMGFFCSHDGLKVDLLIEERVRSGLTGALHARNIQTSKTVTEESLASLVKIEKLLKRPVSKTILAPVPEERRLGADATVRPWHRVSWESAGSASVFQESRNFAE